jgi:hypothetical protein
VRASCTNPFGFTVESVPALVNAVRNGLRDAARWEATIKEQTERFIYKPGSAAEYLAEHVDRFAEWGTHPDWLWVKREPWEPIGDSAGRAHLERLRAAWPQGGGANAEQMLDEIAAHLGITPDGSASA